jgi:hypothetical protein
MPSSGVSTSLNYVTQRPKIFVKSVRIIIGDSYFTNLSCWIWYIKDITSKTNAETCSIGENCEIKNIKSLCARRLYLKYRIHPRRVETSRMRELTASLTVNRKQSSRFAEYVDV